MQIKAEKLSDTPDKSSESLGKLSSLQSQHVYTPRSSSYTRSSSYNPRPIRHELLLVPANRLGNDRPPTGRDIVRRALASPPVRRQIRQWWNFQPTPSRLSTMSTS